MQSIRIAVLTLALCFGAGLLPIQGHAAAPLPKVKIETNMGDIVVELNPAKAPKTVSNFLYYVKSGFYNNTIFHRVINGFMIQGGGPILQSAQMNKSLLKSKKMQAVKKHF